MTITHMKINKLKNELFFVNLFCKNKQEVSLMKSIKLKNHLGKKMYVNLKL